MNAGQPGPGFESLELVVFTGGDEHGTPGIKVPHWRAIDIHARGACADIGGVVVVVGVLWNPHPDARQNNRTEVDPGDLFHEFDDFAHEISTPLATIEIAEAVSASP